MSREQGRNHGWKVEGTKPKAGLGVGCGRGLPPPAVRVGGITPGIFLKTQMLNPAFWWLFAVQFLAFWNLRPISWGEQYIVGPPTKKLKETSLPGSYGCCAYAHEQQNRSTASHGKEWLKRVLKRLYKAGGGGGLLDHKPWLIRFSHWPTDPLNTDPRIHWPNDKMYHNPVIHNL